jgi:hypothetical protein
MTTLIVSAVYYSAPMIYSEFGMHSLAKMLFENHITINRYWSLILLIFTILCVSRAGNAKEPIYYFIAISAMLSYFAGTNSILKNPAIGNSNESDFKSRDNSFTIFSEIFSGECTSATYKYLKYFMVLLLVGALIGMCVGTAEKKDTAFVVSLILYLVFSLALMGLVYLSKKVGN